MKKLSFRIQDSRRGAAVLASVVLAGGVWVMSPAAVVQAAPIDEKHTICHRTHSTTNPYRKITVAAAAVFAGASGNLKNSGHPDNHDEYAFDYLDSDLDGVLEDTEMDGAQGIARNWDLLDDADNDGTKNSADPTFYGSTDFTQNGTKIMTIRVKPLAGDNVFSWWNTNWVGMPASQKKWGDIIPPLAATIGSQSLNYTGAGVTLFSSSCATMTAKQFYDIEVAAGRNPKDVLDDLDDQGANEDKALKNKLGSFSSLCVDTTPADGNCDVAPNLASLESVKAQTDNPGDSDSDSNLEMNGTCTTSTTTFKAVFRYAPTGLLGTASQVEVNLGTFTLTDPPGFQTFSHELALASLLRPQIYDYRLVCITDPTDLALNAELDGGLKQFSTPAPPAAPTTTTTTTIPKTLKDPPAQPNNEPQDPRGHENKGNNDITKNLEVNSAPDPTKPSNGKLTIEPSEELPPVEATGCTISDPDYECEIKVSGPEYNNPQLWQDLGFGAECYKIEPGGYSYTLPNPPEPPSGRTDGTYSLVVVKAGSIRSTDPDFQVRTPFWSPSGGTAVWADSNADGVYNPGGQNGDKEISHIIFCVNYGGETIPPATSATTTTAPGATTTTAPGATTTTSPGATTTTAIPGSSTTIPGDRTPLEIEIKPKGDPEDEDPTDDTDSDRQIAELCVEVTVGVDEEDLCGELDPEFFEFKNFALGLDSEPELPVTGSSSGRTANLALMSVVFGVIVWQARRRLVVDRPRQR